MHDAALIELIAIGLALAFVLGLVADRLGLSPVAGYLLAGILVGPATPGFVADPELAQQLSEIGVMLLMFGVGLHFSIDDLVEVWTVAVPGAVTQIVAATLLGSAMALGMGWSWQEGLVFGLALSVASTVVLLRTLEDRRLLETRRGGIAVGWLVVEDLVTVIALVLLPTLAGGGDGSVIGELGRTVVSVGAFVAVMLVVGRRLIPWTLRRVAAGGSRELFTLAVLAIALGVAYAAATLFEVSYALGAFFAGMLLNESELSGRAASDSLPLRDAFGVLFFVAVGMLFDPSILVEAPWQLLATVFVVVLGKSAAAYLIVRLLKHSGDTALTVAVSLAQIGEFSFILAGLAVSLAVLPEEGRDLVVGAAIVAIVINPFLFTLVDRHRARQRAATVDRETPDVPPGPELVPGGHAIVIGYGRVGSVAAADLSRQGIPVVVIDDDEDLIDKAHADGIPGIRGNALSDRVLADAHPEAAVMGVVAIPVALEAGEVLVKLRAANEGIVLVARAHADDEVDHLLDQGADRAVMAERELAHSLAELAVEDFSERARSADGGAGAAPGEAGPAVGGGVSRRGR